MRAQSLTLFVGDSFFSYLIAKPLFERFGASIKQVVVSSAIRRSPKRIIRIAMRTHPAYFAYRTFVELATRFRGWFTTASVAQLAAEYGIPVVEEADSSRTDDAGLSLGIAVNFDRIIDRGTLARFSAGVINLHASKLPEGKGISPALWSFARGEPSVSLTVYRMTGGLDEGDILHQEDWDLGDGSFFQEYQRLCRAGGEVMVGVVGRILSGSVEVVGYSGPEGSYDGWPTPSMYREMRARGGRLIGILTAVRFLVGRADHALQGGQGAPD